MKQSNTAAFLPRLSLLPVARRMLPPLLPLQRCSWRLAPSRFRPLSFPYWAFSVKKTLHTHLQSPHTHPVALLQLSSWSPAPCPRGNTRESHGVNAGPQRDFTERIFELSLSICRGGLPVDRENRMHTGRGSEGSPHLCGRVLWPSGKAGDATRRADRAL